MEEEYDVWERWSYESDWISIRVVFADPVMTDSDSRKRKFNLGWNKAEGRWADSKEYFDLVSSRPFVLLEITKIMETKR